MDHGDVNHSFTTCREIFVVFAQPAVCPKPADGPFDAPSFGEKHEAFGLIAALDDLSSEPTVGPQPEQPRRQRARVSAIGPNQTQASKAMA